MSARRRRTSLPLLAVLSVLVVSALAACGGGGSNDSELLSPTSASELRSTLAQVEQTVESGDCAAAGEQVSRLHQQVTSLDRVEPDLRDALAAGARRLDTLVLDRCQAPTAETGPTGPTTPDQAAPDEQLQEETGKGKDKNKDKGKGKKKGQDESQQDEGQGDGGSTGSGGFAPGGEE